MSQLCFDEDTFLIIDLLGEKEGFVQTSVVFPPICGFCFREPRASALFSYSGHLVMFWASNKSFYQRSYSCLFDCSGIENTWVQSLIWAPNGAESKWAIDPLLTSSVVMQKYEAKVDLQVSGIEIGPIYTGDGSSVEKDHPSSINTWGNMRQTIGVSCDSSRVLYWTSFLSGFPRKHNEKARAIVKCFSAALAANFKMAAMT